MKTYKGLELFEAIMNFELKSGEKLKCIHYPTYGQGVEVDARQQLLIWSDTKEPVSYSQFRDNDFEFKKIEKKEIEKLPLDELYLTEAQQDVIILKINEMIDEIERLKKCINKD